MTYPEDYTSRICRELTGFDVPDVEHFIGESDPRLRRELSEIAWNINIAQEELRAFSHHYDPLLEEYDMSEEEPELDAQFRSLLGRAQAFLPKQ